MSHDQVHWGDLCYTALLQTSTEIDLRIIIKLNIKQAPWCPGLYLRSESGSHGGQRARVSGLRPTPFDQAMPYSCHTVIITQDIHRAWNVPVPAEHFFLLLYSLWIPWAWYWQRKVERIQKVPNTIKLGRAALHVKKCDRKIKNKRNMIGNSPNNFYQFIYLFFAQAP